LKLTRYALSLTSLKGKDKAIIWKKDYHIIK
jgi:hypothetical protein